MYYYLFMYLSVCYNTVWCIYTLYSSISIIEIFITVIMSGYSTARTHVMQLTYTNKHTVYYNPEIVPIIIL